MKNKKLWFIVLGVIIVAALIVAGYLFIQNKKLNKYLSEPYVLDQVYSYPIYMGQENKEMIVLAKYLGEEDTNFEGIGAKKLPAMDLAFKDTAEHMKGWDSHTIGIVPKDKSSFSGIEKITKKIKGTITKRPGDKEGTTTFLYYLVVLPDNYNVFHAMDEYRKANIISNIIPEWKSNPK